MTLEVIYDVWKLLKPNLDVTEVSSAAEALINYLIEEDYDSSDIRQTFRNDKEIKTALKYYLETPEDGLYATEVEEDEEEELQEED